MLGYFKDFINYYFLKPVYEITSIKSVDIKQIKSEWYFLNIFTDDNQETENNKK
jgi:hypothetical protein